jgi:histidine triad (HIT) family protein
MPPDMYSGVVFMNNCLFCKIIAREIPASIIYEDDNVIAFNDIHPKAEIHFLVIPKLHIASMLDLKNEHSELIANLILIAKQIALGQGLENGYKTHINTGKNGGQEIDHLHLHIYGDRN